jgi:Protein of unknown function (DUF3006)
MSRSARYAIDRIEGDGTSATVVLVADADGATVELPRRVLGRAAVEGAVLRVHLLADGTPDWTTVERDAAEESRRRASSADTLARLRRKDPGGDLTL